MSASLPWADGRFDPSPLPDLVHLICSPRRGDTPSFLRLLDDDRPGIDLPTGGSAAVRVVRGAGAIDGVGASASDIGVGRPADVGRFVRSPPAHSACSTSALSAHHRESTIGRDTRRRPVFSPMRDPRKPCRGGEGRGNDVRARAQHPAGAASVGGAGAGCRTQCGSRRVVRIASSHPQPASVLNIRGRVPQSLSNASCPARMDHVMHLLHTRDLVRPARSPPPTLPATRSACYQSQSPDGRRVDLRASGCARGGTMSTGALLHVGGYDAPRAAAAPTPDGRRDVVCGWDLGSCLDLPPGVGWLCDAMRWRGQQTGGGAISKLGRMPTERGAGRAVSVHLRTYVSILYIRMPALGTAASLRIGRRPRALPAALAASSRCALRT
ncbi:hypothetical protein B0H10DRAFT_2221724 [Mycena sp. CBHHK59/15]|nr:hypothetical protein B0H10DRAFT_2221724 [Mycena sp. CBHHK59/15]